MVGGTASRSRIARTAEWSAAPRAVHQVSPDGSRVDRTGPLGGSAPVISDNDVHTADRALAGYQPSFFHPSEVMGQPAAMDTHEFGQAALPQPTAACLDDAGEYAEVGSESPVEGPEDRGEARKYMTDRQEFTYGSGTGRRPGSVRVKDPARSLTVRVAVTEIAQRKTTLSIAVRPSVPRGRQSRAHPRRTVR